MSNSQWHDDQAVGEAAMRRLEKRRAADARLGDHLRAIGIQPDDIAGTALTGDRVQVYQALIAIQSWLVDGGGR